MEQLFNVIDYSVLEEKTSFCNRVAIFITDGNNELDIQKITLKNQSIIGVNTIPPQVNS